MNTPSIDTDQDNISGTPVALQYLVGYPCQGTPDVVPIHYLTLGHLIPIRYRFLAQQKNPLPAFWQGATKEASR